MSNQIIISFITVNQAKAKFAELWYKSCLALEVVLSYCLAVPLGGGFCGLFWILSVVTSVSRFSPAEVQKSYIKSEPHKRPE